MKSVIVVILVYGTFLKNKFQNPIIHNFHPWLPDSHLLPCRTVVESQFGTIFDANGFRLLFQSRNDDALDYVVTLILAIPFV